MLLNLNKRIFGRTLLRQNFSTILDDLLPLVRNKLKSLNQEYLNLESKLNEEGGISHKKRRQEFQRLGKFSTLFEQMESAYKNM